ncbi:hypothetical protein KF728_09770 [Candidatus Obscuribacterales bacterium]|nr:hypothetical protein [Candidatus Obscuribacterales bacterium]
MSEQIPLLKASTFNTRPKYKQNGISFQRATCKKCNNETLSKFYDPALLDLSRRAKDLLNKDSLSGQIKLEISPVAVMKGVLGHLMAASNLQTDTWLDTLARPCVTQPEKPIPEELHVFYWFFPYPAYASIHRDFAMPSVRGSVGSPATVFAAMKYFPVAFLVTQVDKYANLPNLDEWRKSPLSSKALVPLDIDATFPAEWPDFPDKTNFLVVGEPAQAAIIATSREHKRPKQK